LLGLPLFPEETQSPVEEEATTEVAAATTEVAAATTEVVEKKSLVELYPEIFCKENILVINTVGNPEAGSMRMFNPDYSEAIEYKFAKEKDLPTDWKDIKIVRETQSNYGSAVKSDKKYKGYRKNFLGLILQDLFCIAGEYEGSSIIDESIYKMYPLWSVILQNKEELNNFLDYIQINLEKRGKKSFDGKPVLFLNLKDDPKLETLEIEEIAKIKTLFELVDYKDIKTTQFFIKKQLSMDKIIMDFEGGDPHFVGENMREKFMRKLEKFCADFASGDLIPQIAFWAAVTAGTWATQKVFDHYWSKTPWGKKETA
jgi:hypothetical protein